MRKIVIEQGNEFKIYSREMDIDEDIFREQYRQADQIKESLILYSEKAGQDTWEHLNNLIAFCGDRGQGKSSAMVQFTHRLKKDEKKIEVLEMIDPTAMETVHDILDIVISRMFEQFRKDKERVDQEGVGCPMKLDRDLQLKISAMFQKVHKNLAVLKNSDKFIESEYIYDGSIQNLMDIADSMKLKQDVEALVKEYLGYRKKEMLVVSLDDLDLNISAAYKMMEQIRKYMMLPEIIIVMAVNISQLSLCVERQFLLDMKGLEASARWDMHQEAKRMAGKYLEKLLPLPRRIALPDIRTISSGGASAVEIVYQNDNGPIFDSQMLGIEKGLLKLLYKRTGLLLVAREDEVHPLIPGTLRELVGMVAVIGNMEEKAEKRNVELFEDYLFDSWADNHLEEQERQWFLSLRELGFKGVQNAVVLHLHDWLTENGYVSPADKTKATLAGNVERNASLVRLSRRKANNGNVLNCIRLCYRAEDSGMDKLLFAVSAYLSILMLKLKYERAEDKLQKFIGSSVFGYYQLIREETGEETNQSRTRYKYNVTEYWKQHARELRRSGSNIIWDLDNASVSAIKDYYGQFENGEAALREGLYVAGCASTFEWSSDSEAEGMVADNHATASSAEFSLNNLFIRQLSLKTVYRNINSEKWGLEESADPGQMIPSYWRHFGELCEILVCNMEAANDIGQYLADNRKIKDKTDNDISIYYSHFFKSLIQGVRRLDQYLELEISWMRDEAGEAEAGRLAAALAEFWNSRQVDEAEDESLFSEDDMETIPQAQRMLVERVLQLPSYVRKDSSIDNFSRKLQELINFAGTDTGIHKLVNRKELDEKLNALKQEFERYVKQYPDNKTIDDNLSAKFNAIRKQLLS